MLRMVHLLCYHCCLSEESMSEKKAFLLGSFSTIVTFLLGIGIGILLAPGLRGVHATESATPQVQPSQPASTQMSGSQTAPQALAFSPQKLTRVDPTMTAGTVGFYLILGHRLQSDELVVNGYDLLKLHQAELNLLARFVPPSEIYRAINESKASELYTLKQPEQPGSGQAKPGTK